MYILLLSITEKFSLDELVERHTLQKSWFECEVSREHLLNVSELLEDWKKFARAAGLTEPNIVEINHDEPTESHRRYRALHIWHRRKAFLATYKELVRIMTFIERADIVNEVCILLKEDKSIQESAMCTGTIHSYVSSV